MEASLGSSWIYSLEPAGGNTQPLTLEEQPHVWLNGKRTQKATHVFKKSLNDKYVIPLAGSFIDLFHNSGQSGQHS